MARFLELSIPSTLDTFTQGNRKLIGKNIAILETLIEGSKPMELLAEMVDTEVCMAWLLEQPNLAQGFEVIVHLELMEGKSEM